MFQLKLSLIFCHDGHQDNFPWNLCCYKCFWLTNVEWQTLAVSEFLLKVKGQIGKRCIQPDLAFLQIAQAYLILCTNRDSDSTFDMATFSSAEKQWLLKFATAKTTGMSGCDKERIHRCLQWCLIRGVLEWGWLQVGGSKARNSIFSR